CPWTMLHAPPGQFSFAKDHAPRQRDIALNRDGPTCLSRRDDSGIAGNRPAVAMPTRDRLCDPGQSMAIAFERLRGKPCATDCWAAPAFTFPKSASAP